jgi:hypothetical protein
MKCLLLTVLSLSCAVSLVHGADSEAGFVKIMDGKSFNGWKIADASAHSWKVEDGAFVAHGPTSHIYYVGDPKPFKDFELRVEVMTEPGSNGGIYFHTRYQDTSWPKYGFETQVNVSHTDWIKTGSLYGVVNLASTPAKDNQWWTQDIIVKGNSVTVKIDGHVIYQYNEPPGVQPGEEFTRKLDEGTFALQAHDPHSTVRYRNIRVKRL